MNTLLRVPRGVLLALCFIAAGCSWTKRQCPQVTVGPLQLPPLERADYELLGDTEGYGECLTICGLTFGDGHYTYMNCPFKAQLPLLPDEQMVFKRTNPLTKSDKAVIASGLFFTPLWAWLFLHKSQYPDKATASAAYVAMSKQPGADTILPQKVEKWGSKFLFFYKKEYALVQGKAIHIKSDKERLAN